MARTHVSTRLNGEDTDFLCETRQSLLEVLRDEIGLTGAKEGCNNGNCGACAVQLDGRIVNSCCVLAVPLNCTTPFLSASTLMSFATMCLSLASSARGWGASRRTARRQEVRRRSTTRTKSSSS